MTLRFEPDQVLYDPQERLLRLFATDGVMLVRCAVSKAALRRWKTTRSRDPMP